MCIKHNQGRGYLVRVCIYIVRLHEYTEIKINTHLHSYYTKYNFNTNIIANVIYMVIPMLYFIIDDYSRLQINYLFSLGYDSDKNWYIFRTD
jgi:hypothetical protein